MKRMLKALCVIALICCMTGALCLEAAADEFDGTQWEVTANSLKKLGIFIGTDKGFELEASLHRDECAVIATRLLGGEREALEKNLSHNFTDVDQWASPYIGWLYQNGLVNGVTSERYGSKENITSQQYYALLMRCLGYSDAAGGDFNYDNVFDFIMEKYPGFYQSAVPWYAVMTDERYKFQRADCAFASFHMLSLQRREGGLTHGMYLVEQGAFDKSLYVETLRAASKSVGTDKDGYIVYYFDNDTYLEMPDIGKSDEVYKHAVLTQSPYIIAETAEGDYYALDAATLKRMDLLSSNNNTVAVNADADSDKLYYYTYNYNYFPVYGTLPYENLKLCTYDGKSVQTVQSFQYGLVISESAEGCCVSGIEGGAYTYSLYGWDGTVTPILQSTQEIVHSEANADSGSDYEIFRTTDGTNVTYGIYHGQKLISSVILAGNSEALSPTIDVRSSYDGLWDREYVSDNGAILEIDKNMNLKLLFDIGFNVSTMYQIDDGFYVITDGERPEIGRISKADGKYETIINSDLIGITGATVIRAVDSASGDIEYIYGESSSPKNQLSFSYFYDSESKRVELKNVNISSYEGSNEDRERMKEEMKNKLDEYYAV